MRELMEEVISLQREWSSDNTLAMQRRGQLVRTALPADLRRISPRLKIALGEFGEDADAEGRDGTGRKTRVPWVRWFSAGRSPSAQQGWYLVYLFHGDASGVSLCLSHGSTVLTNGAYVQRTDEEVGQLMSWAHGHVGSEFAGDAAVRRGIDLGGHSLEQAYERTTVFSKFYPAGRIPDDATLEADLIRFCEPLRKLYRAQVLGLTPGSTHLDVADLLDEVGKITAPLRGRKGQGRGLSGPARKLVELHAMELARHWLRDEGFTFKDVSSSDSCDFRASRSGQEWVVEVKGTTGGPGAILLTRNEVELHRRCHPRNALLIVHGIELDQVAMKVGGGVLTALSPWLLDDERLEPICFEYRLGAVEN